LSNYNSIPRFRGEFFYSFLKILTGFTIAALLLSKLTVAPAKISALAHATAGIHQAILMRQAKMSNKKKAGSRLPL